MSVVIRTLRPDDLERAWELDRESFNGDASMRDVWMKSMQPERLHGAFDGGHLLALTATLPLGQYWGGRRVAMGGLSSVSVQPEARGSGLASRVVRAAISAMEERGEVISTLFPGTTALYRSLGWELAGAYVGRELEPGVLLALPRPAPGFVRRAERDVLPALQRCYDRHAPDVNGLLDRDASRWWRLTDRFDDHFVFTAGGEGDEVDGYVVYQNEPPRLGERMYGIRIVELVATTRTAAEALWWTIGTSSSQALRVSYIAPPEDPLRLMLPEQTGREFAELRWMLRINDPGGAVSQRGFPHGLDLEVEIALADAVGPLDAAALANARPFVLRVTKGEGRLEPGGGGALTIGRGAFASLYSGWATPSTLRRADLLKGDAPDAEAALAAAFAGPGAYLLEEF